MAIDYSIFSDLHLAAALNRLNAEFDTDARGGFLFLAAGKHAEADAVRAEIARRKADDRIAFEDYTAAVKDAGGPVDETWERRVFEMNAFNPNVGG